MTNTTNQALIQKADIHRIAEEGTKIYEQIKESYDPKEKGKFLAIDIESRDVYLGNTSADALTLAIQQHPKKVFFVVKIGFDTAETMAQSFLERK
jgi:hydrogenase maturation factor